MKIITQISAHTGKMVPLLWDNDFMVPELRIVKWECRADPETVKTWLQQRGFTVAYVRYYQERPGINPKLVGEITIRVDDKPGLWARLVCFVKKHFP